LNIVVNKRSIGPFFHLQAPPKVHFYIRRHLVDCGWLNQLERTETVRSKSDLLGNAIEYVQ